MHAEWPRSRRSKRRARPADVRAGAGRPLSGRPGRPGHCGPRGGRAGRGPPPGAALPGCGDAGVHLRRRRSAPLGWSAWTGTSAWPRRGRPTHCERVRWALGSQTDSRRRATRCAARWAPGPRAAAAAPKSPRRRRLARAPQDVVGMGRSPCHAAGMQVRHGGGDVPGDRARRALAGSRRPAAVHVSSDAAPPKLRRPGEVAPVGTDAFEHQAVRARGVARPRGRARGTVVRGSAGGQAGRHLR